MTLPPLSTCLIATGLLGLSAALVQKARQPALFGKPVLWGLVLAGVLLFAVGLAIHLNAPVPSPAAKPAEPVGSVATGLSFSFYPKVVSWGEVVQIQTSHPAEEVTVYFNDRPLPKKVVGKATVTVTIPAGSRSGYFALDVAGARVDSKEQLTVNK